jgi:hypothetical protein
MIHKRLTMYGSETLHALQPVPTTDGGNAQAAQPVAGVELEGVGP